MTPTSQNSPNQSPMPAPPENAPPQQTSGGGTPPPPPTQGIGQENPPSGGQLPPEPPKPSPKDIIKKSPFRLVGPLIAALAVIGIIIFIATRFISRPGPSSQSGDQAAAPANEVEITYWGLWEPSQIMEQVFKDFEAANPGITVKYEQKDKLDYRERLVNQLSSGKGPDIFRYHLTWTPLLAQYAAPMPQDVYSQSEFEELFYPVSHTWLKGSKGYIGVPLMYDGLALYYNQTMLRNANQTPPTTWMELRTLANQLTIKNERGEIQRAGVALGTTGNVDHWSDILGAMLLQNAANPAAPNDTLGQDVLNFYTLFASQDKVWDETMPGSTLAFANEKVAMILAPSWRAHEIKAINPNIQFAIAPLPKLPEENPSQTSVASTAWASFWVEGVSASTSKAKQQAAWKLLKYLSQKDTLRNLYTAASQNRLFGEPFSRQDMADQLVGDPYVGAYVKDAPQAKSWFLASATHGNGINDKIIKYYEDAVNAVLEGSNAATALSTAEQGIVQVLNQYGLKP